MMEMNTAGMSLDGTGVANRSLHVLDVHGWTPITSIDCIPIGQGRCFVVGEEEIAVFRLRDGSLRATQNRCPHRSAPLCDGLVGDGIVVCPFHAYRFRLADGGGENGYALRTYPVREVGGMVFLNRLPDL